MSYTSAVVEAVQRHLSSDIDLHAATGGRIFYGGFENQQIPCVTFMIVTAPNDMTFDTDEIMDGEIQVDCYSSRGGGVAGVLAIGERVHYLLNRASPSAAGCVLQTQSEGFPIPQYEEDAWRTTESFRFFAN